MTKPAKTPAYLPLQMTEPRLNILIQMAQHAVQSAGLNALNAEMLDFKGAIDEIIDDAKAKGLIQVPPAA